MKYRIAPKSNILAYIIAAIVIVGVFWFAHRAWSSEIPMQGGSFNEGIVGTPRFINPVLAQSQSDKDLSSLLFSGLLTFNNKNEVVFDLAETISVSEDQKEYTVTLKNNIFFEDGVAVTSDDVVFTIEKIRDESIKSPLRGKWEGIDVEATGTRELKFYLVRPFSEFIYNLDLGILPKHIWEGIPSEQFIFSNYNIKPIGSGPYRVKSIATDKAGIPEGYRLVINEQYHDEPYISNITLTFFPNEAQMIESFEKGNIDAIYGMSPNLENEDFFEKHQEDLLSSPLPRVFGIFFNSNKQPIFKERAVREAIQSAINKQNIVEQAFLGYAGVADYANGEQQEDTQYNPEAARIVLEKNGWRINENNVYEKAIGGKKTELSFSISIPNTNEIQSVAEMVQTDLAQLGIAMEIKSFDSGNLNQDVIRPRDYESLLFGYILEKNADLYAFWHSSQRNDPGLNISLYANPKIDDLLEDLREEPDTTKKAEMVQDVTDSISKDIPAVFLYTPSFVYLLPENVYHQDIDISESSDRFNMVPQWFMYTRHVWNLFISKDEITE